MTFYLFSSGAYFAFLLFGKFSDRDSKTNLTSWMIIIFASALWIFVIPISLIEIRCKARAKVRIREKLINFEVNSQGIGSVEPEIDSDTLVRLTTENT